MNITEIELNECKLYPLLNNQNKCNLGILTMSDLNVERNKWLENQTLEDKCLDYSINTDNTLKCNYSNIYLLEQNCKQLGIGRNTLNQLPCNEINVSKLFRECEELIPNSKELCTYDLIPNEEWSVREMNELIEPVKVNNEPVKVNNEPVKVNNEPVKVNNEIKDVSIERVNYLLIIIILILVLVLIIFFINK
jgi:hypothetical protein